jgi:hypothetical protein
MPLPRREPVEWKRDHLGRQEQEAASPEIGSKQAAMKSYFLRSLSWKNCKAKRE